jgi:hypothetical protein
MNNINEGIELAKKDNPIIQKILRFIQLPDNSEIGLSDKDKEFL